MHLHKAIAYLLLIIYSFMMFSTPSVLWLHPSPRGLALQYRIGCKNTEMFIRYTKWAIKRTQREPVSYAIKLECFLLHFWNLHTKEQLGVHKISSRRRRRFSLALFFIWSVNENMMLVIIIMCLCVRVSVFMECNSQEYTKHW